MARNVLRSASWAWHGAQEISPFAVSPLNKLGLRFLDAEKEHAFVVEVVDPCLARRLPYVCFALVVWHVTALLIMLLFPASHSHAHDDKVANSRERYAIWLSVMQVVVWFSLGAVTWSCFLRTELRSGRALTYRWFSANTRIPGQLMTAGISLALLLDACTHLAIGLDASISAIHGLLAPLLVCGFLPVGPSVLAVSAIALPPACAAGAHVGCLDHHKLRLLEACNEAAFALLMVEIAAILAALVAIRWTSIKQRRLAFYNALVAKCGQAKRFAKQVNDHALQAAQRALEAERLANASQEAAAMARARLIRVLTHNIRSPLLIADNVSEEIDKAAIAVYGVMREAATEVSDQTACEREHGGLPARLHASARTLHHACVRMERILSELTEFELLESGTLRLQPSPFSLCELVATIEHTWHADAEASAVALRIVPLGPRLQQLRIFGDLGRIAQCIGAGVSNAIAASRAGQAVVVSLDLASLMEQKMLNAELSTGTPESGWVLVRVTVRDRGIGIPEEDLAALQRGTVFSSVSRAQLNGAAAAGVGLARVRKLLHLHNDSALRLSSGGLGFGTTFELDLKLKLAEAEAVGACEPVGTGLVAGLPAGTWPGVGTGARIGARPCRHTCEALASVVPPPTNSSSLTDPAGAVSGSAARPRLGAIQRPDQKPLAPAAPKPRFPPGFRVLYAEDDAVLRKSIWLRVFKPLGIEVVEARDGLEAIQLFEETVRGTEEGAPAAAGEPTGAFAFVLLDNQVCASSEVGSGS